MLVEDGFVPRAEINVTPLVDVVLVLLIIFVVITPLLQQGYTVAIPQTRAATPSVPSEIVVSVRPQGALFINREPVTRAELAGRLEEMLKGRPAKTVFLWADDESNYADVIAVMDLVRHAGADRIGAVLTPLVEVRP